MSISYAPWNQPVTIADRVCLRDGDAELSYGHVARRTEAGAERFATTRCSRPRSSAPHPVYGEVPVAYVVTYPGTSVTTAELTDRCSRDLTKIKIPVAVHVVGQLPKNAVGKTDKPALRKSLSAQSA
jgi:hypothetical protein